MIDPQMFLNNIISPPVLFFLLGASAGFLKSDLKIPESASRCLGVYLMTAIGFKGGVALAQSDILSGGVLKAAGAALLLSFLMPFVYYPILRYIVKADRPTAAATAACYGSVSMVTFVAATGFLTSKGIPFDHYIVACLALMEAPAIFTGLFIAHRAAPETVHASEKAKPRLSREIFTNGAILLLAGSLLIGGLTGTNGLEQMRGFLVTPFQGALCFFLLDMGLQAVRNLSQAGRFNRGFILFGLAAPFIGASIGLITSKILGFSQGNALLFVVLSASASYIAAPAAIRLALPQANPSVYIPLSLGVTFPFNVIFGIPIFYEAVRYFI